MMSAPRRSSVLAGNQVSATSSRSPTAPAAYASSYTKSEDPSYSHADLAAADEPVLPSGSPLEQARSLGRPTYEEMLRRDPKASGFWYRYGNLLRSAWKEWEEGSADLHVLSDETGILTSSLNTVYA